MNLKPLGDKVIIKPLEAQDKTKGGIIVPDAAKERPQEGKIVAVGSGRCLEGGKVVPLDVQVGDTVLYAKYSGTEVKIEGEEHLITSESDILAIVR